MEDIYKDPLFCLCIWMGGVSFVAQASFKLRMTLNYKHSASTSPGPGGDGI